MNEHRIEFFINGIKYEVRQATQSGRSLKELAHIPLTDVLFLEHPHEDIVVANDATIEVKDGQDFRSAPPANYGDLSEKEWATEAAHEGTIESHIQPDRWVWLVLHSFPVPAPFEPGTVKLLVKLPPTFPDAAPDMFWVEPHLRLASGGIPAGTSTEALLGRPWQRFSWHLQAGAWQPGRSRLRDFVRCVRARFQAAQ